MKINQEFDELLRNPKVKFTIILGSGIHKKALDKKDSVLSSWELLLSVLDPNIKLTGQYHLDFEKIIQAKKLGCEDSYETEKKVIQCIQKIIKDEQTKVIEECSKYYPMSIFNPDKVSDVISLNFDEVPELLLEQREGIKIGKHINDSSFSKSKNSEKSVSKNTYNYLATRHREVKFKGRESIRFWHPHGDIDNDKSIVLGLHRYSQMLKTTIRIRNHHMKEKRTDSLDNTWYYRLLDNPLIILGAGMSPIEWDMWFALTSRERANEKTKPIFQMRECECKRDHFVTNGFNRYLQEWILKNNGKN